MAQKQLIARGREAARKMQRQKHGIELTQEGRLALVYAFRYALKQRVPGMDNVQKAMRPHLSEFRTGVLEHMVTDIEQEDFRVMLVREIERRKRDGAGSGNGNA